MDALNTVIKKISASFWPYLLILLLIFNPLLLAGCQSGSSDEKHSDKTASQVSKSILEHANKLGDLIPSSEEIEKSSTEQIEKAFAIEYKVVEIKIDSDAEQVQGILSALGKDRWDCSSIASASNDHGRLICKRRPISALRALLGVGGLTAW